MIDLEKERTGEKTTKAASPYERLVKRQQESNKNKKVSPFELVMSFLFLGWFVYCTYAGIMFVYYDTIVSNWFNVAFGSFFAVCLTLELIAICIALVLGIIAWFFGME